MFERFTERARQVVVLAQEEARRGHVGYIDELTILAGLIREEEGLAAQALDGLLPDGRLLAAVRVELAGGEDSASSWRDLLPFTPRAKKVLEIALREALALGHNYIGTEHVLLALVRDDSSPAVELLNRHDVDRDAVRDEVLRLLSGQKRAVSRQPREDPPFPGEVWLGALASGRLVLITDPADVEDARRAGWRVRRYAPSLLQERRTT